jgi:DNA-binding FrmR family transcriptional regulator
MEMLHEGEDRKAIVLRLKRIEGQLRGLQAMIEGGQDCEQVAQQMSAARRALDKTFFAMVACLVTSGGAGTGAKTGVLVGSILARYG